jgi:hypothetical protein
MKQVIELLKQAKQALETGPGGVFYADQMRSAMNIIEEALALLKAPPRFETPDQWEQRIGEKWPDDWAVYRLYTDNDGVSRWCAECYMSSKRPNNKYKSLPVVCATEAGPPPDGWRPEEGA